MIRFCCAVLRQDGCGVQKETETYSECCDDDSNDLFFQRILRQISEYGNDVVFPAFVSSVGHLDVEHDAATDELIPVAMAVSKLINQKQNAISYCIWDDGFCFSRVINLS